MKPLLTAGFFLLAPLTAAAQTGNIVVYVEWPDDVARPAGYQPIVVDRGTNNSLKLEQRQDQWLLSLTSDALVAPLLLRLDPEVPSGYTFGPLALDVHVPRRAVRTEIRLAPYKLPQGSAPVREVFGTDLQAMPLELLPVFYQKARAVARDRMARVGGRWADVAPYDVQGVYKYLEAVWQATSRPSSYIVPPTDVDVAVQWLDDVIRNSPDAIRDSRVGIANAKQLVSFIRSAEGERFKRLWNVVRLGFVGDEQMEMYRAYDRLLANLPNDERRNAVYSVTRITRGHVLSAIAQHVDRRAKSLSLNPTDARKEVADLIAEMRLELSGATSDDARRLLMSDIATLENLEATLPK